MSTRLRRTPLFGQDGHLVIPLVGNRSNNRHSIQKPTLQEMDVGRTLPNISCSDQTPNPTPTKPYKAVNFEPNPCGEKKREKYLTAKYGAHQMALIRKRLKVEMRMFDKLQEICESQTESTNEVDIDLDEVLDIEDEDLQKRFIRDLLTDSKSSIEVVNKFVNDLLERTKTL